LRIVPTSYGVSQIFGCIDLNRDVTSQKQALADSLSIFSCGSALSALSSSDRVILDASIYNCQRAALPDEDGPSKSSATTSAAGAILITTPLPTAPTTESA
jgi:hypothetical protein